MEDIELIREDGRSGLWSHHSEAALKRVRDRLAKPDTGRPDDIRAAGWAVAVHNDYRLAGAAHTFWLFTKGDHCIKGEGLTDADALNQIRAALGL